MKSRVSVRGQTVIPAEIREQLGITANDVLDWHVHDHSIIVYVIPQDPVRASRGILRGKGSVEDFLQDRAEERRREAELEARW